MYDQLSWFLAMIAYSPGATPANSYRPSESVVASRDVWQPSHFTSAPRALAFTRTSSQSITLIPWAPAAPRRTRPPRWPAASGAVAWPYALAVTRRAPVTIIPIDRGLTIHLQGRQGDWRFDRGR